MSSFSWIDNSEGERRRVMEALQSLTEQGTVDELGLGTIRDGFADLFFPGTSTQHTRAGYLLFIPWLYRALQEKRVGNADVRRRGRESEVRLIDALLDDGDHNGVIGREARASLKNLPSAAYWSALHRFGIFQPDFSIDEYHRSFESFRKTSQRDEDGNALAGHQRDWHGNLPSPPKGFPQKASFALRDVDRSYLLERIELTEPDSLLAWLAREATTLAGAAPWHHPQLRSLPRHHQARLHEAQCFSDAMYGASLLYNLLLAQKKQNDALVDSYEKSFIEWQQQLRASDGDVSTWEAGGIWPSIGELANITGATRAFVDEWLRLKPWRSPPSPAATQLVTRREFQLKGARARLTNQRALDRWSGASALGPLVYRWPSARRVLRDLRPELPHAES